MKRRIKLSTLLKRTILVALAVVVVSVVLVYFVDKYSPTKNSYNNKYDDAYWNQEVFACLFHKKTPLLWVLVQALVLLV